MNHGVQQAGLAITGSTVTSGMLVIQDIDHTGYGSYRLYQAITAGILHYGSYAHYSESSQCQGCYYGS